LALSAPNPCNAISIHLYASGAKDSGRRSVSESLRDSIAASKKIGKPLFVGEWGWGDSVTEDVSQRAVFAEILSAIKKEDVQLSAFWCFDIRTQPHNTVSETDRLYVLEALKAANLETAKK